MFCCRLQTAFLNSFNLRPEAYAVVELREPCSPENIFWLRGVFLVYATFSVTNENQLALAERNISP